jgi:hypothetical protein
LYVPAAGAPAGHWTVTVVPEQPAGSPVQTTVSPPEPPETGTENVTDSFTSALAGLAVGVLAKGSA